jgi:DNA-binding MarR family transcriptional regulator
MIDIYHNQRIYLGGYLLRMEEYSMPYERSRIIEERFQKVLSLLQKKRLNAGQLALELKISRPTAHRIVAELKRRGYSIRSVHEEHGWSYELNEKHHPKIDVG